MGTPDAGASLPSRAQASRLGGYEPSLNNRLVILSEIADRRGERDGKRRPVGCGPSTSIWPRRANRFYPYPALANRVRSTAAAMSARV
jgi:hypothetical protein